MYRFAFICCLLSMFACQTNRYYPATYSSAMDHFALKESTFHRQKFVLSCSKKVERQESHDEDMCLHLASLFEKQGAEVFFDDEEIALTANRKSDEEVVKIHVLRQMKWSETSQFDRLLYYYSLACYPHKESSWYETQVTTTIGDQVVDQDVFKSQWVATKSWCVNLYLKTAKWIAGTKTEDDYKVMYRDHFDKFVSQLAYSAARQLEWQDAKEEVSDL